MKKAKLVAAVVAGLLVGAGGVGVYEYSRATPNVARVAFCLADVKNAPVAIMVKQGSKTLVTANYSFPGTWTSAPIGNVSGPITIEVAGQSRTSALTAKPGEVAVFSQGNCPAWHDPLAATSN